MATGVLGLAPTQDQVAAYTATKAASATPQADGYQPNEFSVAPTATVSGQLDSLIKQDSPLLQQARQRAALKATQDMNQRGLLNSSLTTGAANYAADSALYDKALPIAQQDAQTYGTASTNTTNAQNAALYAKMQADNAAAMRDAELKTNVSLANADAQTKAEAASAGAANQFKQTGMETTRALQLSDNDYRRAMDTARLDAQTRLQLANVDRETRVELSTIENNYRQLLQTNQDLASMYNQVSTNIANIATSNMSPEAKSAATTTQLNTLRAALAAKQGVMMTQATSSPTTAPNIGDLALWRYFSSPSAPTTAPAETTSPATTPAPAGTYQAPGTSLAQRLTTNPAPTPAAAQPTAPAIPSYGTPAPQYGPGAYTYSDGRNTLLYVPGQGTRPI